MSSPSAGIGDPYFYEWSVGHKAIIDMLNPDNNIHSVCYQSKKYQGWDDVVVKYNDGYRVFYQVKHTRENNTLTFSDFVSQDDNGKSFLSYLAQQWKFVDFNPKNKFIVYSNRILGDQKYKQRPSLSAFWKHLENFVAEKTNFDKYSFKQEFDATIKNEWFGSLSCLNSSDIYKFISQLEIQGNQPDLDKLESDLINGLCSSFGVSKENGKELLKSLDHALRKWASSFRNKEEVTIEDVYEVLQINRYQDYGDHHVLPPDPFFPSRKDILVKIEQELKNPQNKILFLSGSPGIGKTSLISELYRKNTVKIHLRYYTFKPISPDNDLLPADAGKTCEARNLWGELLNQLRFYFKGELARYNVPLRNEFLENTEKIRSEVLRLSKELAVKEKQRIIICIDGIDHAARARIDANSNYLETLIPPDNIPDGLLFFIVGQPVEGYPKYPVWLKTSHINICHLDVSNIVIDDIQLLLKDIVSPQGLKPIADTIFELTNGNTLSVIYAVETVKLYQNTEKAIEKLKDSRLKDGLTAYYNQIWDNALSNVSIRKPSIPTKIASYFSLTIAKLTPDHFVQLFNDLDYSSEDWDIILKQIKPLLKDDNGYAVLHNDLKVFFTKIVSESGNAKIYQQCAKNLFELIFSDDTLAKHRYFNVSDLIIKSKNFSLVFQFLTPKYVLEAFQNQMPRDEIENLIKIGLNEGCQKQELIKIQKMNLVLKTLNKLDFSLSVFNRQWNNKDYSRYQISELSLASLQSWNLTIIDSVLDDILTLFRKGYRNRALSIISNWFGKAEKIDDLIDKLDKNIFEEYQDEEKNISQDFQETLKLIGKISCYSPIFTFSAKDDEYNQKYQAFMNEGFEEEASKIEDDFEWIKTHSPYYVYFVSSAESMLYKLINERKWIRLIYRLRKADPESLSDLFKNIAYSAALISGDQKLIKKWAIESLEQLLSNINGGEKINYFEEKYMAYAATGVILGVRSWGLDEWTAVEKTSSAIYRGENELREIPAVKALLHYSFQIGLFLKNVLFPKKENNVYFTNPDKLFELLNNLLKFQETFSDAHILSNNTLFALVNLFTEGVKQMSGSYKKNLVNEIKNYYSDDIFYSSFFPIFWRFLYEQEEYSVCQILLEKLIGSKGILWTWSYSEKIDILDELSRLTRDTKFEQNLVTAKNKAAYHSVGFSNHKDYSLYSELYWYNHYIKKEPNEWKDIGLKLLFFSESISNIADNRANRSIAITVLKDVIKSHPQDAFSLLKDLIYEKKFHHSIFIEALKLCIKELSFNSEQLLNLWITACSCLYLTDYQDKKELLAFKNLILNSVTGIEMNTLAENMEKLFPVQFNIEKIIQKDDSESQKINKLPYETIEENLIWAFSFSTEKSDALLLILNELSGQSSSKSSTQEIINDIFNNLIESEYISSWEYNGMEEVYEGLFPFLSCTQKWHLLQAIIGDYYRGENSYLYYFEQTLDWYCLYYSSGDSKALKNGFEAVLDLHNLWLNGFEDKVWPDIALPSQDNYGISSYDELIFAVLIEKLSTRSGIQIEAACQGLAKLIINDSNVLKYITNNWSHCNREQRDYLLQIFEIAVRIKPDYISILAPILDEVDKDGDFIHRAQAGLVRLSYYQVTGVDKPAIQIKSSPYLSNDRIILLNPFSSLHIRPLGMHISCPEQYFTRKLELISSIFNTDSNDIEYLRNQLSKIIQRTGKSEQPKDYLKSIRDDFIISDRFSAEVLGEVLDHELSEGMFQHIDPFLISQILLCNDDPVLFLKPYKFHPDFSLWPDSQTKFQSLSDDSIKLIMQSGLHKDEYLLGAVIKIYAKKNLIEGHYNTNIILHFGKNQQSSTFNGRSVFTLYDGAFHVNRNDGNIFVIGGGMSRFLNSNNLLIPSIPVLTDLGWNLRKEDPTVIEKDGKKLVWLEKYLGPDSEYVTRANQQNILHRWICKKETVDAIKDKGSVFGFDFNPFLQKRIIEINE